MEATVQKYEVKTWQEKTVLNKWFWVVLCGFFFAYPLVKSIKRELPPALPIVYQLPQYELRNQFGKPFGSKDLEGKVYIASFFFTSCPSVCPRIMDTMTKVQKRVRGLGDHVALVSFTVDPQNDSAQVLLKKAKDVHANPYVWSFLTGPQQDVHDIIVNGFKLAMGGPESIGSGSIYDIAHSEKFVLVDRVGRIRGFYPSGKDGVNKLMIDIGLLANRKEK